MTEKKRRHTYLLLLLLPVAGLDSLFWFYLLVTASPSGRVVQVGVYENPPKVYQDEEGRPAGRRFVALVTLAPAHHGAQSAAHAQVTKAFSTVKLPMPR